MVKETTGTVRSHAQEREWLLSLGNGNIVAGVRSLIQETKKGSGASNETAKGKPKKSKK